MDYKLIPKDVSKMTNEELKAEWEFLVPAHCRINAIERELWDRDQKAESTGK